MSLLIVFISDKCNPEYRRDEYRQAASVTGRIFLDSIQFETRIGEVVEPAD